MSTAKHPQPPLPEKPEKPLYEYSSFEEIPDDKKPFVRRFLTMYLDWVVSQPQFDDADEIPPDQAKK